MLLWQMKENPFLAQRRQDAEKVKTT